MADTALSTLRSFLRLLAIVGALLVYVPLDRTWAALGRRSPWPRRFLRLVGRAAGARARVSGEPLARAVFVSNHLSWVDVLMLAGVTGTAFVAKGELRAAPVVGWLCTLNRTIFVRRGDRMGVAEQVAAFGAALADGWSVTLFPEGTTGDGARLLPFKTALLAALDPPPPGVRVQPVLVRYSAPELAWVGAETGIRHVRRVLGRHGSFTVDLTFLDPFDPAMIGDRKAIAREARARMAAALGSPEGSPACARLL